MRFSLTLLSFSLALLVTPTSSSNEARAPAPGNDQLSNGLPESLEGRYGIDASYDYVVVGGGTAGLALAARLSEDPDVTVAIVEAGGIPMQLLKDPIAASTPAGAVFYTGSDPSDTNSLVDWGFVTTPQAGCNGRQIHYEQGKVLSGSTGRNYLIYQRGTEGSFQKWADMVDDDSFTFENLLPYFKKSVEFSAPSSARHSNASAAFNAAAFDPNGGPVRVSYPNFAQPFSSWLEPALNEIGIPTVTDFNSGRLLGCQYCSTTINPEKETRESSETSFLQAAKSRSNLKVYYLAFAKKILFDKSKRATGVRVSSNGGEGTYDINARKEVILSAGAFHSPQLLMVSGVGPRETLESFGIPVVSDRPGVGQNMQDHVLFGLSWRVKLETFTRLANDPDYLDEQFSKFSAAQQGPLTSQILDFLGWEKIPRELLTQEAAADLDALPDDWPELEYLPVPGYVGNYSNLVKAQPKDGYQYASVVGALVAPMSRGNVTIVSADTKDLPIINPNWMTHQTDISAAIAAFKRLLDVFASSAMGPILADEDEYFPGPDVSSDTDILEVIRDTLHTVWHASCTCKMGRRDDRMAVVDNNFKVYGVEGLRVCDASSFAFLVPGHPQSAVYCMAEKCADDIKMGS